MRVIDYVALLLMAIVLLGCDKPSKTSPTVKNPSSQQAKASADADDDKPSASSQTKGQPARTKPIKVHDDQHLHNVFKVHKKVLSGGQPHGEDGFKALQQLGVKTVISVDGAKPEVELAKKYGMRYVHLPHGYDGVPEDRTKELAKAVRDLEGPVYIHCHHGKHRSPAASAVACVAAGLIAPQSALAILEAAGTSKGYRGLYQSAQEVLPLDPKLLDALEVEFKEVVEVAAMADAMVEIEHRHDHLKQVAQNQWQLLADHPDIAPAHEALMLREHFTELLRSDEVKAEPARFQELMQEGEQRAQALEDLYRGWESKKPADGVKQLHAALEAVNENCALCHKEFRDVPLREKGKQ
jgi:protein tyrosine phosphatase (PTP) superfamily phosphohydrolase (DUF442 family)